MKNKRYREQPVIDCRDEIKRLNRIVGQVEGVRKMLEDERDLQDILIQCKAVHSALRSIEYRLLRLHLEDALDALSRMDKRKNREQAIEDLEELFRLSQ